MKFATEYGYFEQALSNFIRFLFFYQA